MKRNRSDRRAKGAYSTIMNDTRNGKKDKKQHIQVFIRVRPLNNAEKSGKSVTVVDTPSCREVVVRERLHDKFTKKFTFDRVFGPYSKQIEVYNAVVRPLLGEVLDGYNCTVFAYGQTGTGKTFTMEGTDNDRLLHWQADINSGIIPRSLSHLFDELRTMGTPEYSVRVSFLELYNEELYDLLSPSDDAVKIRIYDDSTKKGAVIVHGLEEMIIRTKSEVFSILQKGSEKRQTATTLMNAHSSRSHTIFSITIHIKENSIHGEELLKTGKLNLVDLAGSENIGRSGSVDMRAREAGSINQSLLTLGRVITALVEKTPHVPYRESKLTRLLQESLGGRTRTSIIATVSPASINLEETLSTLDYAHRAKNITNRPEINQKFSKRALLQEYTEEIEKLKKDLVATRERNGIYLAPDRYSEITSLIHFQSKEIDEKLHHIKALEDTLNWKGEVFNELKSKNSDQSNELLTIKDQLEVTTDAFTTAASRLTMSEQEKEEQKYLVEKHASTESILLSEVQTVLDVANTATTDVQKLHDKIYRKAQIGQRNSCLGQQFKANIRNRIREIEADVSTHAEGVTQFYMSMAENINAETRSFSECIDKSNQHISENIIGATQNVTHSLTKNINDSHLRYKEWLHKEIDNVTTVTKQECDTLSACSQLAQNVFELIDNEIAENLRDLNKRGSEQIDNLIESTKHTVTLISKHSVEECDLLNNDIQDVWRDSKAIRESQNDIIENRASFATMMEDLQRCFNELRKEEEESHSSICDKLSNIDGLCNGINNENINSCRISVEEVNSVQEALQHDLQIVKQTLSEETEKSRIEAEDAIVKGKALISEFQAGLRENCDTLTSHKDCAERNIREIQRRMKEDESRVVSSIKDMNTTVRNAGYEHINRLNAHKATFIHIASEMDRKLESETENVKSMNTRITAELQAVRDKVEKFFVDDLYRDVPTGSTPARKEFRYVKKLTRTSPYARILARYRETLKDMDSIENEEPIPILNNNSPIKESLNAG